MSRPVDSLRVGAHCSIVTRIIRAKHLLWGLARTTLQARGAAGRCSPTAWNSLAIIT